MKLYNCLITGASSGIGKNIAIELSKVSKHIYIVSRNVEKAKEVIKSDIEIDKTYDVIYEKIVDMIKGKVSKLRLLTYTKLLFAIKTLERAGDHIENVAEEIHFIVTGENLDLKSGKMNSDTVKDQSE